jgi:hypothetical protein
VQFPTQVCRTHARKLWEGSACVDDRRGGLCGPRLGMDRSSAANLSGASGQDFGKGTAVAIPHAQARNERLLAEALGPHGVGRLLRCSGQRLRSRRLPNSCHKPASVCPTDAGCRRKKESAFWRLGSIEEAVCWGIHHVAAEHIAILQRGLTGTGLTMVQQQQQTGGKSRAMVSEMARAS